MELETALAIDDETVRAFYDQHPGQFSTGELVHASHILIGVSPTASEAERRQSSQTAKDLRIQIINNDADFADLARRYSTDAVSYTHLTLPTTPYV